LQVFSDNNDAYILLILIPIIKALKNPYKKLVFMGFCADFLESF